MFLDRCFLQIKNITSITVNRNFWDFLFESGKISDINQTILQTSQNQNYHQNIKLLIENFFNHLSLSTVKVFNQNGTSNVSLLINKFHIFNSLTHISVFLFILFVLFASINLFFFFFFLTKTFLKNNLYLFMKVWIYFLFNIFAFYSFYWYEEYFLFGEQKKFFKKQIWSNHSYFGKFIFQLKSKKLKINKQQNFLLRVQNLSFSYETMHNFIKHLIDCYKYAKFSKTIDEEKHFFSFSKIFFKKKETCIVLKNINLEFKKNSFNVIIGPNGCGKSTLVKLICGINDNYRGEITLHQQKLSEINKKELSDILSYVPQELYMPDGIIVYDFLSLLKLSNKKINSELEDEDHDVITEALEKTNCLDFWNKNISELSGGQRQKILLASILVKNAEIVVLDEPTTYFDLKNQFDFLNSLKELQKQGKTIIIIMHDIEQALNYADNLIVLKNGKVYDVGEPKKIMNSKLLSDVFKITCELNWNNDNAELSEVKPII